MAPATKGCWAACSAVAGDDTGRLFGVARCAGDPSISELWVADVFPDALRAPDAQDAAVALGGITVSQVVRTAPAIDFDVTAAAASPDGHQLLLVGTSRQDDSVPVLALVDVYASQPAPAGAPPSASHPGAKQRLASLLPVHQGLYGERPSLRILQVAWHPGSSAHFAALASDNRWRLYHTARLAEAEQTFALRLPGAQQSVGLRRGGRLGARGGGGGGGLPARVTGFAFGPPGAGWASLAVLFLASDGGLYALCPVAPFGLRMPSGVLQRLLDASQGTAHAWLLAAFLSVLAHESDAVAARPHLLETAAPALQGPLNAGAASLRTRAVRSVAGFSNGTIYAHALELGQVVPAWLDAAPQCAYDRRGEVAAVRYEAEPLPMRPAAPGLSTVPEDDDAGSAWAGGGGGLVSPLLLLDALRVNLHRPPGGAGEREAWADDDDDGDAWDGAAPADSEEASDAGYDPARGAGSTRRALGFGAPAGSDSEGDDGDDDDGDDDDALLQLSRLTLHAAPELPGRFWAAHDQGAWGINVRWLGQLAARLEAAAGGGGAGDVWGSAGAAPAGGALPAPSLQELLVSGSAVVGSTVVGNALLGSGCVLLEAAGDLVFLRPRPAGVLGEGVLGGAGGAALDALGAEADDADDGVDLTGGLLRGEALDAKARMEEFYDDIFRGPRRLPPPARPDDLGALTASDAAGLAYLNAASRWLVATHVQFATGAHADMVGRVRQLHDEVHEQAAAVASLQQLAQAAAARQEDLAARLARLTEVSNNLAERGALLAGLHWSLPRPPSAAEHQLGKQLEVWEKRRDQLRTSWRGLRERLDAYTTAAAAAQRDEQQEQQQQQQPTASGAAPARRTPGRGASPFLGVPALAASRAAARGGVTKAAGGAGGAQLERLKDLLAGQALAIGDARERLAALYEQLDVWATDHPEAALPGRLHRAAALV
ncbi:NUP88 [Scenedesmus sp. PABB004]|nr:NUP88 [Scenedesmus sp. PABB004]